ncbi:hypothetical protein BC832DRAFT_590627 [Gaertneriomyces semiglobifer]|nr:hypothetical protein BC832DRAFT_590627 [Gaertneriomyces semiglobifer]
MPYRASRPPRRLEHCGGGADATVVAMFSTSRVAPIADVSYRPGKYLPKSGKPVSSKNGRVDTSTHLTTTTGTSWAKTGSQLTRVRTRDSAISISSARNENSLSTADSSVFEKAGTNGKSASQRRYTIVPPLPSPSIGQPPSAAPTDDQGVVKAPIPWRVTPMESAWTMLNDDESWETAREWDPNNSDSRYPENSISMQEVNPISRRWRRDTRVGPGTSSSRPSFRQSACQRKTCLLFCMGLLLAVVITVVVTTTVRLGKTARFDPQSGPRGGLPGPPPGPPLPVLNVLDVKFPANSTNGGVYFGAAIDWSKEDPQSFNKALGRNAAIIDGFYMISETLERASLVNSSGVSHSIPDYFNWTAGLIGGTGGIMGMTLLPHKGLENVTLQAMQQLGQKCAEINGAGIPILLKFAPEMNGYWYPWGQRPSEFVRVFRQLVMTVRNATNATNPVSVGNATSVGLARTAVVWAPTSAHGYPYITRSSQDTTSLPPQKGDPRFAEMDTNGDGVLDVQDDPFSPYYPGDEFVDWIGVTGLFNGALWRNLTALASLSHSEEFDSSHYLNVTAGHNPTATLQTGPYGNTIAVANASLVNQIPPTGLDVNGTSFESLITGHPTGWNLYEQFAAKRQKPFLVSDTAIGYVSGRNIPPVPSVLDVKSAWWNQSYSVDLYERYPHLRAIVWYDYAYNLEDSLMVDFSLSRNGTVMEAFVNITSVLRPGALTFANETYSQQSNNTVLPTTMPTGQNVAEGFGRNWTYVNGVFRGTLHNGTVVEGRYIEGVWVPTGGNARSGLSRRRYTRERDADPG